MADLNTTSYALLGLLNQHPWSAYELTQFMRVSYLRAVWPRAESRLYEGPKKLVKLGYATASSEQTGKRPRTIYSITDDGRDALREWLKSRAKDVIFEHEALLKLANADVGDIGDLHAIVAGIGESTASDLQEMLQGFEQLADQSEQLSSDKRFIIGTLVNQFLHETMLARMRWLNFAEELTSQWDDLEPSEEKLHASRKHYSDLVAQLKREVKP